MISISELSRDELISSFQFHALEEALVDLKRRLGTIRWPHRERRCQGLPLARMKARPIHYASITPKGPR
jgi:hypothetical protein